MRAWLATAVLVAALAPAGAFAQRVTPTLSTTMQRTCQGETGSHVTFDASGQRPTQPQRFTDTRAFRAERAGAGYRFVQQATNGAGETVLTANVAADGAVSDAALSGPGFEAALAQSPTQLDVPALAASLAVEIPERLMINRSFAQGDDYYPPDLRDTLVTQMTAAMGLPFPIVGSITIPFQGQTMIDGHSVLVWEGDLTMSGSGPVQGGQMALQSNSRVRVVHDAATGLVRSYTTSQTLTVQANGQPFLARTSFDNYVCEITPQ